MIPVEITLLPSNLESSTCEFEPVPQMCTIEPFSTLLGLLTSNTRPWSRPWPGPQLPPSTKPALKIAPPRCWA